MFSLPENLDRWIDGLTDTKITGVRWCCVVGANSMGAATSNFGSSTLLRQQSHVDLSKCFGKSSYFSDINPRSMKRLMNILAVTGTSLHLLMPVPQYPEVQFLSPNQQCQSTEGKISHSMDLLTPSSPEGLPTLSLTTNSSWLPWGRVAVPLISPVIPVAL